MTLHTTSAQYSPPHQEGGMQRIWDYTEEQTRIILLSQIPLDTTLSEQLHNALRLSLQQTFFSFRQDEELEVIFERALKNLNDILMTESDELRESLLSQGGFVISAIEGDEMILTACGVSTVYLVRQSKLMEISEGLSPRNAEKELFSNIATGVLEAGDRVMMTTLRLTQYLSERQISSILEAGTQEAVEYLQGTIPPGEPGGALIISARNTLAATLPSVSQGRFGFLLPALERVRNTLLDAWYGVMERGFDLFQRTTGSSSVRQYHWGLFVASLVAIALVVTFSRLGSEEIPTTSPFAVFIEEIEDQFLQVDNVVAQGNSDRAMLLLREIEETATQMVEEGSAAERTNGAQILERAQEKREEILDITRIKNPAVVVDLSQIRSDIQGVDLYFLGNELFVFDEAQVYRSVLDGEAPTSAGAVSGESDLILGTSFPDRDSAVFRRDNGSVVEWQDGTINNASTADSTWKDLIEMATFNRNLYFLSPSENQIWKYERRDASYTTAEAWIQDESSVQDAISFTIDGSIYLLQRDGNIQRYFSGEEQAYVTRGMPDDASPTRIVTNETTDKLYMLDREASRILVFSKGETEAVYERSIILEDLDSPVQAITVRSQKLYILAGARVYEIAL